MVLSGQYGHQQANRISGDLSSDQPDHGPSREVQRRTPIFRAQFSYAFGIQGVCDEDRAAELWSRHLSLETLSEETDVFF